MVDASPEDRERGESDAQDHPEPLVRHRGEEAAAFRRSIFDDSWSILTAQFDLGDQRFVAINGGPELHFGEALSLEARCESQAEIDRYWARLGADAGEEGSAGGRRTATGLLADHPIRLEELMTGPDRERFDRVMAALLEMRKIDGAALERAAAAEQVTLGGEPRAALPPRVLTRA